MGKGRKWKKRVGLVTFALIAAAMGTTKATSQHIKSNRIRQSALPPSSSNSESTNTGDGVPPVVEAPETPAGKIVDHHLRTDLLDDFAKDLRSLTISNARIEEATTLFQQDHYAEGARIMYREIDRIKSFLRELYENSETTSSSKSEDQQRIRANPYAFGHTTALVRAITLTALAEKELKNVDAGIRLLAEHCSMIERIYTFSAQQTGQCYTMLLEFYLEKNDLGAHDLLWEYIGEKHDLVLRCAHNPEHQRCAPTLRGAFVYDAFRKTALDFATEMLEQVVIPKYFLATGRERKNVVRRARQIPEMFVDQRRPIGSFPKAPRVRMELKDSQDVVDETLALLRHLRGAIVDDGAAVQSEAQSAAEGRRRAILDEFIRSQRTSLVRRLLKSKKTVRGEAPRSRTKILATLSTKEKSQMRQISHQFRLLDALVQTTKDDDTLTNLVEGSGELQNVVGENVEDGDSMEVTEIGATRVHSSVRFVSATLLLFAGFGFLAVSQGWIESSKKMLRRIRGLSFATTPPQTRRRKSVKQHRKKRKKSPAWSTAKATRTDAAVVVRGNRKATRAEVGGGKNDRDVVVVENEVKQRRGTPVTKEEDSPISVTSSSSSSSSALVVDRARETISHVDNRHRRKDEGSRRTFSSANKSMVFTRAIVQSAGADDRAGTRTPGPTRGVATKGVGTPSPVPPTLVALMSGSSDSCAPTSDDDEASPTREDNVRTEGNVVVMKMKKQTAMPHKKKTKKKERKRPRPLRLPSRFVDSSTSPSFVEST